MFITTFTYTKADGSVSQRTIVPFVTPGQFYAGMDIGELSEEAQALYLADLIDARSEYEDKLKQLAFKHDLHGRYRQFSADKVTNLKYEEI